jgi:hypothetical protein
LAKQFPYDINSYVEGKTEYILAIPAQHGLTVESPQFYRRSKP